VNRLHYEISKLWIRNQVECIQLILSCDTWLNYGFWLVIWFIGHWFILATHDYTVYKYWQWFSLLLCSYSVHHWLCCQGLVPRLQAQILRLCKLAGFWYIAFLQTNMKTHPADPWLLCMHVAVGDWCLSLCTNICFCNISMITRFWSYWLPDIMSQCS
jgi:hypothetical protein